MTLWWKTLYLPSVSQSRFAFFENHEYGLEEVSATIVCCWVLSDHIFRHLSFDKGNRNDIMVLHMIFRTPRPTEVLSVDQNKGNTNKEINMFLKIFLFSVACVASSRKNLREFPKSPFSLMFEFQSNAGGPNN